MRLYVPALTFLLTACTGSAGDCDVQSTVSGYESSCEGVLVLYLEESRLIVDGRLVAYLPADVRTETVYGGTTGNVMIMILDGVEVADGRTSTITFGSDLREVHVHGTFTSGSVVGILQVSVEEGEEISI